MLGGYKTYTDYSSSNYDIKKAAESLKVSLEKSDRVGMYPVAHPANGAGNAASRSGSKIS